MMNRREFLQLAAALSAGFGITGLPASVSSALKNMKSIPVLIYLQGQSCSGCSVSLLQTANPSPFECITSFSSMAFHSDISAVSDRKAFHFLEKYIHGEAGEYFLVLEGAIPEKLPEAAMIGLTPAADIILKASETMKGAVAVGTCATDGGVPGAEDNPTGAVSLQTFLRNRNISKPVVNIPGCPVHPDWVWRTITRIAWSGMPVPLTENKRPEMFFSKTLHDTCPRLHDFLQSNFAEMPGDKGCLFKLGCNGPVTRADCAVRGWNSGITWCVKAGAPCVGCASEFFAHMKNRPFYRLNEKHILNSVNNGDD